MQNGFIPRFLRNVALTGIGTLSQIGFGFLGLMVAVRMIPQEDFGIFVLLQIVVMFLIMLGGLVAQTYAVTRMVAGADEGIRERVALTAMNLQAAVGVLIALAAAISVPAVRALSGSERLGTLMAQLPLLFFLNYCHEQLQGVLQGFHRYRVIALAQTLNGGVRFLCTLVFLGLFGRGVLGFIEACNVSFLVSVAVQFAAVPVRKRFLIDRTIARQLIVFGFPLGLNSVFTLAFTRIDRFIITAMIGPAAVAVYEVAARLPDNGYRLFQSFLSVFFPSMTEMIAGGRIHEAERVLNHSLRVVTFLSMLVTLVAILFQEDIVRVLFSERYLESAPVLSLLMMSIGIGLVENLLGSTLIALGYPDKPVKINTVNAAVNILGAVLLIPHFGLVGAAGASLLARAAANPVYVYFLRKGGIRADVLQYGIPMAIFGICAMLFLTLGSTGTFQKGLLILLLLSLSIRWSVISAADLNYALQSMRLRRS